VLGALQDSYQQFQYQLSCNLARDHPELSEQLCEEMMTRQLECADKVRPAAKAVGRLEGGQPRAPLLCSSSPDWAGWLELCVTPLCAPLLPHPTHPHR
jgi:hypothetical protein